MRYWRNPLDAGRIGSPRGDVHILTDRCKGCGFCVEYCPREVLEMSREFNRKGYHPPVIVDAGACVNCGLCEMICPEFAIFCVAATSLGGHSVETAGPSAVAAGEVRP
jgi:2-oxoglutarate ferredoxin oxidoreductase subunit delta